MRIASQHDLVLRGGIRSTFASPEHVRILYQIAEGMTVDASLIDALHENVKAINALTSLTNREEIERVARVRMGKGYVSLITIFISFFIFGATLCMWFIITLGVIFP